MLYAIHCEDVENSLPRRQKVRHLHLERLQALSANNRLVLAGPYLSIEAKDPRDKEFTGSLIVAEFDNLKAATDWVNEDPYTIEGVFKNFSIKPFTQVLP